MLFLADFLFLQVYFWILRNSDNGNFFRLNIEINHIAWYK